MPACRRSPAAVTLTPAGADQLAARTRAHETRLDAALASLDEPDRARAALPALFHLAAFLEDADG
ncbi:MarR family transcriptional regulator [Streptomyces noursei PD-1]|nr:MarR family transcriptional regulator [Streptomyces noursei PD-1]